MSTFFEGSGVTPTEMEFISRRVKGLIMKLDVVGDDEPSFAAVLGQLLELTNKDKVSPRDAALIGFILGGGYSLQRMAQGQAATRRAVLAEIREEEFP